MGVSFLYDTQGAQSLLIILNYDSSDVLQTFRTNFTRLQIAPDFKQAYHKSGRNGKIKLTVRKLWNKQSLYMHILSKSESTRQYGDCLYPHVLQLLEQK
jgi:hypothetical protein